MSQLRHCSIKPHTLFGDNHAIHRTDTLKTVSTPTVSGDPTTGQFEYFYDAAGRRIQERYPDNKDVLYDFDENGNLIKMTYPDSFFVEREYDELDRLTAIKLNGAMSSAVEFNYDELSRREVVTFENGVDTSYDLRKDDKLVSLEHSFNGSSVTFSFDYNDAHQMIEQEVSDPAFMWHPSAGGTVSYGTAGDTNEYTTVGGASHTYNDNGCLTSDNVWDFVYDTENHLLSADNGSTLVEFFYDPHHRQGQKKVGSAKTRYIYAGWQRIAEYDESDSLVCRYVYGQGLDEVQIKVAANGDKTYYHANHQGSIVANTDDSGVVTDTYNYSPFGESGSMSGTSFGFTGQRYDAETGLYYFKHRYYSVALGRFLQPDPIGFGDGPNHYMYVGNDPLNLLDPRGLTAESNLAFLTDFVQGTGESSRYYGPDDFRTHEVQQSMLGLYIAVQANILFGQDAPGTVGAESTAKEVSWQSWTAFNYTVSPGLSLLVGSLASPVNLTALFSTLPGMWGNTAAQIGGVERDPRNPPKDDVSNEWVKLWRVNDNTVRVKLHNIASADSFFLHAASLPEELVNALPNGVFKETLRILRRNALNVDGVWRPIHQTFEWDVWAPANGCRKPRG